ncbi:shikimate dehydrogenase family protein [Abyssalbus ytuae]|uniref:Shikimate dehydrogenase n=1 Tax=Abyssalbus ytuae TaxID=2926907 RepID=A0A9E6ZPL7_9FLAO|nr:shikimate dehydrogenase [Abyssalbus ytuae]UOB18185.1 shikimate dehydrogenase [Abyssalbus ytuae]
METGHADNLFGLLGKNISYSFSQGYFTEKFNHLGLKGHKYINFDIDTIEKLPDIIRENPNLKGMNVTIPYKEKVIPYLTALNKKAKRIGAVNTIKITPEGLKGYNTDCYGFKKSLQPFLKAHHKKALILGTGGASKAIAYVLDELGIDYYYVSRKATGNKLSYDDLNKKIMDKFQIIINCTPLGTFPNIQEKPDLPYKYITQNHLLYDLIYNPEETTFLKLGREKGAQICNGLKMLQLQAEKAWNIWNK